MARLIFIYSVTSTTSRSVNTSTPLRGNEVTLEVTQKDVYIYLYNNNVTLLPLKHIPRVRDFKNKHMCFLGVTEVTENIKMFLYEISAAFLPLPLRDGCYLYKVTGVVTS